MERARSRMSAAACVQARNRVRSSYGTPSSSQITGVGVGAAEAVVGQQQPDLLVAGDQPGVVADRGADPVDRAVSLQPAQRRCDLQRIWLLERQLDGGGHRNSFYTINCILARR